MPVTVDQYLKSLGDSGIMSPQEVAALQRRIPPDEREQDAQPLAAGLVRMGLLTKYQAASVYHGTGHALVMGNYLLLDKLGQGDHGVVYKAQHREKGLIVAVKVLLASRLNSPEAVEQLERQVNEAKQLEHPNLVTLFGFAQAQGHHFLVMEYVEGRDFASLLKEQGTLPLELVVDSIVQAGRALEYAHAKGVIHGDIKPSHLLLTADRTVKLVDVGLAYAAAAASERSDITALGHTLYTLVTGKPASPAADGKPAAAPLDRKDVPNELEAVYQKMVGNDSEHQYGSMSEVLADLQPVSDAIAPVECETTDLLATLMKDASVAAELLDQPLEPVHHQAKTPAHPPRPRTGHGVMTQQGVVFLSIGIIAAIGLLGAVFWAIFGDRDTQQVAQKQDASPNLVAKKKPDALPSKLPPMSKNEKNQPKLKVKPEKKASPKQNSRPGLKDPDRHVAQWFFGVYGGGLVVPLREDTGPYVKRQEDIPVNPFRIRQMNFHGIPGDRDRLGDLQQLVGLEGVYFSSVKVDELIPYLEVVPNLRRIGFSDVRLPEGFLAKLKRISKLNHLSLSGRMQITPLDYRDLAGLSHLERLTITLRDEFEDSVTDTAVVRIAELRKLRWLIVGGRNISDAALTHIAKLTNLERLYLRGKQISDNGLKALVSLENLQVLGLRGSGITGRGLEYVVNLPIVEVIITNTPQFGDEGLRHIGRMKNLVELAVTESSITDDGLRHLSGLTQLRKLKLGRSNIGDAGIRHLHTVKSLREVGLYQTKVSRRGAAALKKAIPTCEVKGEFK